MGLLKLLQAPTCANKLAWETVQRGADRASAIFAIHRACVPWAKEADITIAIRCFERLERNETA